MGLPKAARVPVAPPSSLGKVVSKQDGRRSRLISELRAIRDEHGDDFYRPVSAWAHENQVAFYRIDGMTWTDTRINPADVGRENELYLLTEQAAHHNYPKDRWDADKRVPDVLTVDEVPAFLEEARTSLPQTEEEFVAALPATPYWEDTSDVDEEALLKKFRNKTSQKKETLTPQELFFLVEHATTPQAERIKGWMDDERDGFVVRARKVWSEGSWKAKWELFLNGRHHLPVKPVKPQQVWGLLTVEQQWKLLADGVKVPDYVD